jgi:UDP-N-acetylglucosamine enolpyruvyl transferase
VAAGPLAGNKNAALPIVCAALLTEDPVTLENVPRIRDIESLLQLVRQTVGATAEWTGPNTLVITARAVRGDTLDPSSASGSARRSCSPRRSSRVAGTWSR